MQVSIPIVYFSDTKTYLSDAEALPDGRPIRPEELQALAAERGPFQLSHLVGTVTAYGIEWSGGDGSRFEKRLRGRLSGDSGRRDLPVIVANGYLLGVPEGTVISLDSDDYYPVRLRGTYENVLFTDAIECDADRVTMARTGGYSGDVGFLCCGLRSKDLIVPVLKGCYLSLHGRAIVDSAMDSLVSMRSPAAALYCRSARNLTVK